MPGSKHVGCVCKGRTQEGKSRCTQRITRKGKKFSAQLFVHLIPDYDYVKGDSLGKKCYERLRKEKIVSGLPGGAGRKRAGPLS